VDVITPLLAAAAGGFLVYLLFPVIGPAYTLGARFPYAPPPVAAVLAAGLPVPDEPRNCMPSLHTAWVLLLWWHARPLGRPVRLVAGLYVAATLLATLGFGFHYFFDLVTAFPIALAVEAICRPGLPLWGRRGGVLAVSVALFAAWLVVLRFGLPLLAWSQMATAAAALGTIALALALERPLRAASLDPAGA
jgi:hypothetical protein